MRNYIFKKDWFSKHIDTWQSHLLPMAGEPHLNFLEIGSFEGRSAVWFLENILTHTTSKLMCIDPYVEDKELPSTKFDMKETEEHYWHNIAETGVLYKVTHVKKPSKNVLPYLQRESFDLIYIDGSHTASDVLEDAVFSFLLLKPGGIVIFGNYILKEGATERGRPKIAIDAFLKIYYDNYQLLYKQEQVILCKVRDEEKCYE